MKVKHNSQKPIRMHLKFTLQEQQVFKTSILLCYQAPKDGLDLGKARSSPMNINPLPCYIFLHK